MTGHDKEIADLVSAGRHALRPSAADRARVKAALGVRLAEPLEPVEEGPQPLSRATNAPAARVSWTKPLLFGAGAVALAVVVALSLNKPKSPALGQTLPSGSDAPKATTTSGQSMPTEPVAVLQEAPPAAPEVAPIALEAAPVPTSNRQNQRDSDSLAQEVALLGQAEKAFHMGNLSTALSEVDEHRRRFPRGALALERRHLRVQILCRLGRVRDAEKEQGSASAARQSGGSAGVCGAASSGSK